MASLAAAAACLTIPGAQLSSLRCRVALPARQCATSRAVAGRRTARRVSAAAAEESSTTELVAAVAGLIAVPVVSYSLYTLQSTGCGLPPGPGGSLGALEGISFLVIPGIVGWSAYTKYSTGKGLPNGPFGLLGAVEGLSYLVLLAAIVVFGLQIAEVGSLPSAVPDERCFG